MPTLVREPSPLSTLPPRVPRPSGIGAGQWAAARLDEGDLGPSMLELVLWLPLGEGPGELSEAAALAALGPAGPQATVRMSRLAVQALVPELASALPSIADDVQITGASYAATVFESQAFFGARVVRAPGGVLVAVRTGG